MRNHADEYIDELLRRLAKAVTEKCRAAIEQQREVDPDDRQLELNLKFDLVFDPMTGEVTDAA